jgi:UDP-N-acetylmuramyl tripeptide synthase
VLGVLNDRIADGRDVSWIWDADFETLAPRVRHATCAGTRAAELALR